MALQTSCVILEWICLYRVIPSENRPLLPRQLLLSLEAPSWNPSSAEEHSRIVANISAVGQGPLLDLGWLLRYFNTLRMDEMLAELECLVIRFGPLDVRANTVSSLSAVGSSS